MTQIRNLFIILLLTATTHATISMEPYFSQATGKYYKEGVDVKIIQDINSANSSIELAMYFLTNKNITNALIDAYRRGVTVKVFTDDTQIDEKKYQKLTNAGIIVASDKDPQALMHNKLLIIDTQVVWISSGNYTVYAFYRNNDNYLRIEDSEIANYYRSKFLKLYTQDASLQPPYLSKEIEIYFAPDTDIEKRLLARINNATKDIYFLAYTFTNQKLADALIAAHKRGVVVRGVFDEVQHKQQKYSVYSYLKDNAIAVALDSNHYKMHHKVMIVDQNVVVVGSYNFTHKANSKNAENIIVVKQKDIAHRYLEEFERIYP